MCSSAIANAHQKIESVCKLLLRVTHLAFSSVCNANRLHRVLTRMRRILRQPRALRARSVTGICYPDAKHACYASGATRTWCRAGPPCKYHMQSSPHTDMITARYRDAISQRPQAYTQFTVTKVCNEPRSQHDHMAVHDQRCRLRSLCAAMPSLLLLSSILPAAITAAER